MAFPWYLSMFVVELGVSKRRCKIAFRNIWDNFKSSLSSLLFFPLPCASYPHDSSPNRLIRLISFDTDQTLLLSSIELGLSAQESVCVWVHGERGWMGRAVRGSDKSCIAPLLGQAICPLEVFPDHREKVDNINKSGRKKKKNPQPPDVASEQSLTVGKKDSQSGNKLTWKCLWG